MPSSTIYTPLEALLLFLYLRSYGISAPVFVKISDQLKESPQVRENSAFDPSRLSPDALRDYFLRLWKEELRYEGRAAADANANANADASNGSPRKRKAPSPSLPTVQDAAQNVELLPKVILRLYGRYREQAVAEIRESGKRCQKLKQEVDEISSGDWDARLQKELDDRWKQQALSQQRPNGELKAPIPAQPKHTGNMLRPPADRKEPINRSPSPNSTTIELPKTVPRKTLAQQAQQHTLVSGRPPSATPQIVPPIAPSPYRGSPSVTPQPLSRLPSDRPASPLTPHPQATHVPSQSPLPSHIQQTPTNPLSPARNSINPVIAPQYQPVQSQPHPGVQTPPYPPPLRAPLPQYGGPPFPSQRGGRIIPPFQVSPQVPTPLQQQSSPPPQPVNLQPQQPRIIAPPSTPAQQPAVSTPGSAIARPDLSLLESVSKLLRGYQSPALGSETARRTTLETRWKASSLVETQVAPASAGDISPISEHARSPEPEPEPEVKGRTRRQKAVAKESAFSDFVPLSTRSGRKSSRKARGASTTSSAVGSSIRGRTRSQSVVSHASLDHVLKPEPSTPIEPMDVSMSEDTPMPAPGPTSRRTTRNKRKRSVTATSEAGDTVEGAENFDDQHLPQPIERTKIFAVRNFPRLSNTVMNDIMSHKHASIFSNPVRDRDAEGYSSMIRRPTDLKSIKVAIGAGARAVNAANVTGDSASSGVLLPWSEDLVPPKALVNSAQLERELMRMFANAVMFNSGEEGVVADAREMFESAEASLVNFRSAEKTAEASAALRRREESEVSQPVDEETGTGVPPGKRRKGG